MPEQGWPAAGYSCCCIGSIPVWLAADAIALDRPLSLRIVCQPWPLIADRLPARLCQLKETSHWVVLREYRFILYLTPLAQILPVVV